MRIKQLYSNFGIGFKEAAINKFDLIPYTDTEQPMLMVGCYNTQQLGIALTHRSLCVILWCGSDAQMLTRDTSTGAGRIKAYDSYWAQLFRSKTNIKHIAQSHWIAEDLKSLDILCHEIPVTLYDNTKIEPCHLGDSIYMYKPQSTLYNGGIYEEIKSLIPYNIIENIHPATYTREEILNIYKESFLGLRFTEHDGLSETVAEMGMMGRKVIHNGDLPNCIHYKKDVDSIIEDIHREYEKRNIYHAVSHEVKSYLDVGEDWLNTEYYEN